MSEKYRELSRAITVVDGRTYGLIVYEASYDDWDDPEGYFTERCALFGPGRPMPEPGWEDDSPFGPAGEANIIGLTRDGGRYRREVDERHAEQREQEEREKRERRAKVTPETERVTMLKHEECDHVGAPDEFDEPAYECSRCGQTLRGEEGRRCPDDNIFTAKVAERSCPSCEQAIEDGELTEVVGVEVDGHFVPETELSST